jgi:hypothetical protein
MATTTDTVVSNCTDDATFRAWATKIHNALVAVGLIETNDTGKINLATVTRPASSTFAGFEMFRFDDSLQATKPVFLKVEYGMSSSANVPAVRFTVGTATDGAGTLTAPFVLATCRPTAVGTHDLWGSGVASEGRFAVMVGMESTASGDYYGICFERGRNSDGSSNGDKQQFMCFGTFTTSHAVRTGQMDRGSSGPTTVYDRVPAMILGFGNIVVGGDHAVAPILHLDGKMAYPPLGLLAVRTADVSAGTQFTVTRYGTSRNYRRFGVDSGSAAMHNITNGGPTTAQALCMIFE